MPQNKNALIRYKTIDKCLQNRYRTWTLDDLIEACSEALYEYEGKIVSVGKRTIQLDIQMMRSDKLGYNAPIVVYDKKFYKYEDENYSITNIPLTENDMHIMLESVEMLKQFKDFSLFSELSEVIHRLEDKVYTEKNLRSAIIHLDKNEKLKGLEHLDILYQAILRKIVVRITYQSFKARQKSAFNFSGFILKEFNNRWFLVGKRVKDQPIVTLALDRIISVKYNLGANYLDEDFDGDEYYKNTIGVTVFKKQIPEEVILKIERSNAPYVLTKPMHHSQEVIKTEEDGSIILKMQVHTNFELERLILGFGETIEVIAPRLLRKRIAKKLKIAAEMYQVKNNSGL